MSTQKRAWARRPQATGLARSIADLAAIVRELEAKARPSRRLSSRSTQVRPLRGVPALGVFAEFVTASVASVSLRALQPPKWQASV
jgi:hypothetical protein